MRTGFGRPDFCEWRVALHTARCGGDSNSASLAASRTGQFVDLQRTDVPAIATVRPTVIFINGRPSGSSSPLLMRAMNVALSSLGLFSLRRRLCDAYRNLEPRAGSDGLRAR